MSNHPNPIQDTGGNYSFTSNSNLITDKSLYYVYWNDISSKPSFCNICFSANFNDITNKPNLNVYSTSSNLYYSSNSFNTSFSNLDYQTSNNLIDFSKSKLDNLKSSLWTTDVNLNIYSNLGSIGIGSSSFGTDKLVVAGLINADDYKSKGTTFSNLFITSNVLDDGSNNLYKSVSNLDYKSSFNQTVSSQFTTDANCNIYIIPYSNFNFYSNTITSTCNSLVLSNNSLLTFNYTNQSNINAGTYNFVFSNGSISINSTPSITDKSYPILKDGSGNTINPSAWYKFDDSTNLGLDSSVNNITLINTNTTNTTGIKGDYASSFNGSSSHLLNTSSGINLSGNNYSVSFWQYARRTTNGIFISVGQTGTNWTSLMIGYGVHQASTYWFTVWGSDYFSPAYPNDINTWVFVTYVYNASSRSRKFYRNGVYIGGDTQTSNLSQDGTALSIGRLKDLNYWSDGFIDDFRIYNGIELTQAQITELYNGRVSILSSNINLIYSNVGIGTSSSLSNDYLTIGGDMNITELKIKGTNISNFLITSNVFDQRSNQIIDTANSNATYYGSSAWTTNYPTSSIFLNLEGNVGIGSANPKEKLDINGNLNINGNILPNSCNSFDLGSSNFRWKDIYLSGNSIYLDDLIISNSNNYLSVSKQLNVNQITLYNNQKSKTISLDTDGNFISDNKYLLSIDNNQDNSNIVLSNVLSNSSNSIFNFNKSKFNSLNTDIIKNGTSNKFITNDTYSNAFFSSTIQAFNISTSNLNVIGDTTTFNTTIYQTEQLLIENSCNTPAFIVKQMNINQNVAEFYSSNNSIQVSGTGNSINIANDNSNYRYAIFTSNGTFTINKNLTCDILIVGGGGGGGSGVGFSDEAGGGGAGGVVYMVNKILTNGSYNIIVGDGGNANSNGNDSKITNINNTILIFDGINLVGKGGGKGASGNGNSGGSGGSGGGGCYYLTTGGIATQGNTFWNGSTYVAGGYNGGTPTAGGSGAGGGGASESGNTDGSGYGGDGILVNITGLNNYYAGGGNAYPNTTSIRSDGGGGLQNGVANNSIGLANTGSGGGGGYTYNGNQAGGKGGSGVVIIRYLNNNQLNFLINSNGNIGISSAIPSVKLDVNGNTNSTGLIVNNNEINSQIKSYDSNYSNSIFQNFSTIFSNSLIQYSSNSFLNINNSKQDLLNSSTILLGSGGSLTNINYNNLINKPDLSIYTTSVNSTSNNLYQDLSNLDLSSSNSGISYVNNEIDGLTKFLWITNGNNVYTNSNVGIGTTVPSEKLDINGNISTNELLIKKSNISNLFITSNVFDFRSNNYYTSFSNQNIKSSNTNISYVNNIVDTAINNYIASLNIADVWSSNSITNYSLTSTITSTCNSLVLSNNSLLTFNYTNNSNINAGTYNVVFSNGSITFGALTPDKSYPILKDANGNTINPTAWYKFDDSTNIGKDEMNTYNASNISVVYNNTNFTKGTGSALFVASNNSYLNNININLDNKDFSICVWIRILSINTDSSSAYKIIFANSVNNGTRTSLHIVYNLNTGIIYDFWSDNLFYSQVNTNDLNIWVLWCFTFNNTNKSRKIYKNGSLVASGTAGGSLSGSGTNYRIGRRLDSDSSANLYFDGNMDDFRIYNGLELTQAQITELYNGRVDIYSSNISNIIYTNSNVSLLDYSSNLTNLNANISTSLGTGSVINSITSTCNSLVLSQTSIARINYTNELILNSENDNTNPILWYKFNGSSTFLNDTYNNSNNLINSNCVYDNINFIRGNGSIKFTASSSQFATIPNNLDFNNINITNGISISLWVNISTSTGIWGRIFEFGTTQSSGNGTSRSIQINKSSTTTNLEFGIFSPIIDGNQHDGTSSTYSIFTDNNVINNNWYHYVWTISTTGIWNIYRNSSNILNNSQKLVIPAFTLANKANYFGKSKASADGYLDGNIDDFRIYNRVLSQNEINNIYNNNSGTYNISFNNGAINIGNTPYVRPWGAYFADDWSGTTLLDSSGNGRHATTSGTITKTTGSGNGATGNITYISGGTSASISWPSGSIPSTFTILGLTRYNGGTKRRVLQGSGNWFLGHWDGNPNPVGYRGVAFFDKWNTPVSSIGNINDWLCCIGKNSGTTPNNIIVDGLGRGSDIGGTGNFTLGINVGLYGTSESSDWALSCVIIYDSALSDVHMSNLNNFINTYKTDGNITNLKANILGNIDKSYPILKDTNGNTINPNLWYKFDSSSLGLNSGSYGSTYDLTGNTDVSQNSNDFTKGNSSASFNGSSSYLYLNSSPNMNGKDFTISFWEKKGANSISPTIFSIGDVSGLRQNIFIGYRSTNYMSFNFFDDDFAGSTLITSLITWNFWTFTYNTTSRIAKIFLNGILDGQKTLGGSININQNRLWIGRYTNIYGTSYHNGIIDDLRMYEFELTSNQILELYNGRVDYSQIITSNYSSNLVIRGDMNITGNLKINNVPIKFSNNNLNISVSGTGNSINIPTDNSNFRYALFTSNGTFTTNQNIICDILVVGGGGGGGSGHGGGGGAGALIYKTNYFLLTGTYNINIGIGGSGGLGGGGANNGTNGNDTTILLNTTTIFKAKGGGKGNRVGTGGTGGSGGGAGGDGGGISTISTDNIPQDNDVFGFGGGSSTGNYINTGGGGGAGGSGNNGINNNAGSGGIGKQILITGNPVFYAGGGGGSGSTPNGIAGQGGLGGGGSGGSAGNNGISGIQNSGGGGGGSGYNDSIGLIGIAGSGGSGVVIIRYNINQSALNYNGFLNYYTINNRPYLLDLLTSSNIITVGRQNNLNFPLSLTSWKNEWFLFIGTSPTNIQNSFIFHHITSTINSKWWFNGTTATTNAEISDERVKNDINDLSNGLDKLMLLKPKEYFLCDEKDYFKKYGIIAQDVYQTPELNHLVYKDTDFIANIYSSATYSKSNGLFILTSVKNINQLININDELKILLDNNQKDYQEIIIEELPYHNRYKKRFVKVKRIIDDYSFEIFNDIELTDEEKSNIFIYGKKINDFLKLDYSSLYTLNIKANQEIYDIIQNTYQTLDNLTSRVKNLENKIL